MDESIRGSVAGAYSLTGIPNCVPSDDRWLWNSVIDEVGRILV